MHNELLTQESTQKLISIIETAQLEGTTANSLKEAFVPFFEKVTEWKEKALQINVTSIEQRDDMKQAREGRLALKEIRVAAEKMRKALKEDSLKKGKAIDAAYNLIESEIKPLESHLEQQEKFAEIQEAKRLAELKAERLQILAQYNAAADGDLLVKMSDELFDSFVLGAKQKYEARIEAERKAEAERIERERLEAEERERQRLENERLKKEAAEREEQMRIEREEAERVLAEERAESARKQKELEEAARIEREKAEQERKERERIEAERLAAERAEKERLAKIEAQRLEAQRLAALAPDADKLAKYIESIESLELPVFESENIQASFNFIRIEILSKGIAKFRELLRENQPKQDSIFE